MNKLLLGLSILLSVVLMSGCGSGSKGSAGADGAAGAKGDTGATGASGDAGTSSGLTGVLVPSADTDLAITASTTVDSDVDLGQVARAFTLSGTDNQSADSTLRYYGYLGKSSSSKNVHAASAGTNEVTASGNSITDAWPLDTRHKAGDNYTLTLDANDALGDGDGSITHLIVCPGNYAGDATSCASAAIEDRGSTSMVGGAGDNATIVNFVNGLTVIRASGGDYVAVDTLTVPSTKDGALVDSGTLKEGSIETSSQAPGVTTLAVTDTYIVGLGDNATAVRTIDHTASSLSATDTNFASGQAVTDITVTEGYGSVTYVVIQNDNDNISVHSISSGALITFNDNSSSMVRDSPLDDGLHVSHCAAANPSAAEVVSANFYDNATAGLHVTKWNASSNSFSLITTVNGADNVTFANLCAMAWAADGSDSGKLYIAASDNATSYEVCVSTDNGTSCGTEISGPRGATAGSGYHLDITTDPETYQPIVAFNKNGRVYVDRYDNSTSTWETVIDLGASAVAVTDTVSVTTSGNDHIILATQGATADNSTVVLFYDE